jgi:hypothetical protein
MSYTYGTDTPGARSDTVKRLFLILFFAAAPVLAQQTQARLTFKYSNPQLDPASYILIVNEDGSGSFHSESAVAAQNSSSNGSNDDEHPSSDRKVHLSQVLTSEAFSTARLMHFFTMPCEDGKAKIAYQGIKTLIYEGADGHGSCEFNWSRDVHIQRLADQMIAVATTLTIGRRLESEHRYDRLGLDEELENLTRLALNGQAVELSNIADTLQAIADDESVVSRARRRARALLGGEKVSVQGR